MDHYWTYGVLFNAIYTMRCRLMKIKELHVNCDDND